MPTHPTHEALSALKLDGMAEAFAELITEDRGRSLDPVAWIGLMLDREQARRGTRRFQSRLRAANLRHSDACMEDVNWRTPRGLDRALFSSLGNTDWIDRHRSVLITGPCGVGKSWLACALGHAASRADRTVLYHRLPRLFFDLELARGDGRFDRLFRKIARADLLILDDWGPDRLTAVQRRDLMEIVEERYGRRSTIMTSQLPLETWHEVIAEPTFADAMPSTGSSTTPTASPSTGRPCARRASRSSATPRQRPQNDHRPDPGLPTGPSRGQPSAPIPPLTESPGFNHEDLASDRYRRPVGCPWNSWPDVAGISRRMPWNTQMSRLRSGYALPAVRHRHIVLIQIVAPASS